MTLLINFKFFTLMFSSLKQFLQSTVNNNQMNVIYQAVVQTIKFMRLCLKFNFSSNFYLLNWQPSEPTTGNAFSHLNCFKQNCLPHLELRKTQMKHHIFKYLDTLLIFLMIYLSKMDLLNSFFYFFCLSLISNSSRSKSMISIFSAKTRFG